VLDAIRDKTFRQETIRLDGNLYINCSFEYCVLLSGGDLCEWENTSFHNCRVILNGAANNTTQVLKALGVGLTLSGPEFSLPV
jgi:hypothetical protein